MNHLTMMTIIIDNFKYRGYYDNTHTVTNTINFQVFHFEKLFTK